MKRLMEEVKGTEKDLAVRPELEVKLINQSIHYSQYFQTIEIQDSSCRH